MLKPARKSPERLQVLERVEAWTRRRFSLAHHAAVHVWEIACAVAGCPPVETAVLFWIEDRRYQFKVFKPIEEIVEDDLPPAWYLRALAVSEGIDCDCC
jgi:nitrate reductase delta subunit